MALPIPLRIWTWALAARPLKHVLPLPFLVRIASATARRSATAERRAAVERRLAAYLVRRGPFPARPPGNCLERSLGAYRVLCSLGADVRLVIGIRPRDAGVDGHVWVVLDGKPFAEAGDVDTYARIVAFDARGRREGTGPSADLRGVRWA